MKVKLVKENKWAANMSEREIMNWIKDMHEIKRYKKAANYWDGYRLIVYCPDNKPLAILQ